MYRFEACGLYSVSKLQNVSVCVKSSKQVRNGTKFRAVSPLRYEVKISEKKDRYGITYFSRI